MKAIDIRSRKTASKKEETSNPRSLQLALTEDEREILLKACKRYRQTIPAYLKSKQPEIRLVDAIIEKLS
jgi:hypothetical protein